MLEKIKVIAFDIDGTLYPSFSLYRRLVFYVIKKLRFYVHFKKVRSVMHRTAPLPSFGFYEYQGRLLAHELGCSVEEARASIKGIVYDGLKPYFKHVKPFKDVERSFKSFKEAGYRLAILSDFPPDQKGEMWGLIPYCDFVMGSEEIGALKPSKYPFGVLAMTLGVKPEEVLYVGNSTKYDVLGAQNAGMMSAQIGSRLKFFLRKVFKKDANSADINFSTYRQLMKIVLN